MACDKGLAAGDQVVTSNFYRLQPGTRIRANAATEAGAPQNGPAPRQAGSAQTGGAGPAS